MAGELTSLAAICCSVAIVTDNHPRFVAGRSVLSTPPLGGVYHVSL